MDGWPRLDPEILAVLQKTFGTPLCLQASFDDDVECASVLQSIFPDMIDEEVRDLVAGLVTWQTASAPSFKRMRAATVLDGLFRLPPSNAADIQASFQLAHVLESDCASAHRCQGSYHELHRSQ